MTRSDAKAKHCNMCPNIKTTLQVNHMIQEDNDIPKTTKKNNNKVIPKTATYLTVKNPYSIVFELHANFFVSYKLNVFYFGVLSVFFFIQ